MTRSTIPVIGIVLSGLLGSQARADILAEIGGDTSNFVVLYEGKGNKNKVHVSGMAGVTNINGNVGIGGTGTLAADGSGTITGTVDFSAGNTGQCGTSGAFGYNCGSALYNRSDVTTDLADIGTFSSTVGAESGAAPLVTGTIVTINAASGTPDKFGNKVFTVPASDFAAGNTVTVKGGAGDNVIVNVSGCGGTCNIDSKIAFNGISPDQVMFNITGGNELKIQNTTVEGIFVDPSGQIFVSGATITGYLYGGGDSEMQIVSGVSINPTTTPEPVAFVLAGTVLLGSVPLLRRKFRRAPKE